MKKKSAQFFQALLETISPSGYEQPATAVWLASAREFCAETWLDSHGNAYARLNRGGRPRVMLAGHVDEIGLMITYADPKGFLSFQPIGGWDPQMLTGQRVWIRTVKGPVLGVIGKKPIHKLKPKEREQAALLEDLWIDIGAKNRKEALARVELGDPAVVAAGPERLPGGLWVARSTDDKAGAFTVLEALRLLSEREFTAEVTAVATVQEEVGLRGATTSAYALDPEVGIAVDVTFATDFPSMDQKAGEIKLGGGPAVTRGPNINPALFDLLRKTAKAEKIRIQIDPEPRGTGTDANRIQLTRAGVATALVSVPNRYMHSPCEMIHEKDMEDAARLIAATVVRLKSDTRFVQG